MMEQPIPSSAAAPPSQLGDGYIEPPSVLPPADDARRRRFGLQASLRQVAARGTLINTAFMIGLSALGLVKNFVLAGFLSRSDYGVWGILVISLGTLVWLKQGGIGDKYVQQDEADQEVAFQKAFTLELALTGGLAILMLALLPVIVLAYHLPQLTAPGIVIVLGLLISVFQAPLWVFYRRMQFARQRTLQAADPVVAFVASVALAVAGAGYWAFVGGFLAGVCASAALSVIYSPFKLRLRYERGTLRSYAAFSWPLFVAGGSSLVMVQTAVFVANARLGVAATGVIALTSTVVSFADRVDQLVTGTLYPAICAVQDKTALLYESFVKSNRLALMWAVPFGFGIVLFCSDLVSFGIGERWRPAVAVLQIFGIAAGLNQIGFNWTAYLRARAETKPIALANFAAMVAFLAIGIPLLLRFGLRGFAVGILLQTLVHLACRVFYLKRLFHDFGFLRHSIRGFLPTVPATGVVLLLRAFERGDRTLLLALGELSIYVLVTAVATWFIESSLLREAARYASGRRTVQTAA